VLGVREVDRRVVAEVAHEALLRAWPRLADWLREERDFLVCKGDTERAHRRWLAMGQVEKALLTGFDLARAEEWLPTRSEDLSPEVTAFVQSSAAFDRATKERQLRFQRRVSIGAVAAALLMSAIGGFAWFQWREADQAKLVLQGERDKARAVLELLELAERATSAERDSLRGQIAAVEAEKRALEAESKGVADRLANLQASYDGLVQKSAGPMPRWRRLRR
jgi:hypothetical protein